MPSDDRRVRQLITAAWLVAGIVVVLGVAANIWRPTAPAIPTDVDPLRWFDAAFLATVDDYHQPRYIVRLTALIIRVGIPLAVLLHPAGRRAVAWTCDRFAGRPALAATLVVVAVLVVVELIVMPLSFWLGYIHETRWGFRVGGPGGWLRDWAAAIVPGWIGAAVATAFGYVLARRLPRAWPPVLALLGAVAVAVVVLIAPVLLEPLTYRHEPLEEGSLRSGVIELLERADTEVDEVLVADASRRTTRHNAYVSGLGPTRRVVLWDTLVAGAPEDQVIQIVAHELAHDAHGDLLRGVLLGGAGIIVSVGVLAALLQALVRRGHLATRADPRGVVVVLVAVVLLTTLARPIEMAVSRRAELAADYGAMVLTEEPDVFVAKQLDLTRTNLGDPDPPGWYRMLWATHPTAVERLTLGEVMGGRGPE